MTVLEFFHQIIWFISWLPLPFAVYCFFRYRKEAAPRDTTMDLYVNMGLGLLCWIVILDENPGWWVPAFIFIMAYIFMYPLKYREPYDPDKLTTWHRLISTVIALVYLVLLGIGHNDVIRLDDWIFIGLGTIATFAMFVFTFFQEPCFECHKYINPLVVEKKTDVIGEREVSGVSTEKKTSTSHTRGLDGRDYTKEVVEYKHTPFTARYLDSKHKDTYKCPLCGAEYVHTYTTSKMVEKQEGRSYTNDSKFS